MFHKFQEDLRDAGVIPCYEDEDGFNPFALMDMYLNACHPENPRLFQQPVRLSKQFSIHSNKPVPWYSRGVVGKNNNVGKLMPNLCAALDIPLIHNHQVRATGISTLNRQVERFQV